MNTKQLNEYIANLDKQYHDFRMMLEQEEKAEKIAQEILLELINENLNGEMTESKKQLIKMIFLTLKQ